MGSNTLIGASVIKGVPICFFANSVCANEGKCMLCVSQDNVLNVVVVCCVVQISFSSKSRSIR
jgi:hypothetical protein